MQVMEKNKYLLFVFAVFWVLLSGRTALCETVEKPGQPEPEINVTADRLVSDRNKQFAEFTGRVVAIRADARLTCDNLKVFYKEEKPAESNGSDTGAVEKMVATGSVVLTFEDKRAVADKAVYTAADDAIVLTGGEPKLTAGNSFSSGKKITLYRTSGRVVIDSGESIRVKAEFHPADKRLFEKEKEQK